MHPAVGNHRPDPPLPRIPPQRFPRMARHQPPRRAPLPHQPRGFRHNLRGQPLVDINRIPAMDQRLVPRRRIRRMLPVYIRHKPPSRRIRRPVRIIKPPEILRRPPDRPQQLQQPHQLRLMQLHRRRRKQQQTLRPFRQFPQQLQITIRPPPVSVSHIQKPRPVRLVHHHHIVAPPAVQKRILVIPQPLVRRDQQIRRPSRARRIRRRTVRVYQRRPPPRIQHRNPQVELALQLILPLAASRLGRQDQQPRYPPLVNPRLDQTPRLDRLAQPYLVRDQQPVRPLAVSVAAEKRLLMRPQPRRRRRRRHPRIRPHRLPDPPPIRRPRIRRRPLPRRRRLPRRHRPEMLDIRLRYRPHVNAPGTVFPQPGEMLYIHLHPFRILPRLEYMKPLVIAPPTGIGFVGAAVKRYAVALRIGHDPGLGMKNPLPCPPRQRHPDFQPPLRHQPGNDFQLAFRPDILRRSPGQILRRHRLQ